MNPSNLDAETVAGFGDEWSRLDQSPLSEAELRRSFDLYFAVFPWAELPPNPVGFDMGCGSGRWAKLVAERVGTIHCVDAAAGALGVARRKLEGVPNAEFHLASVDALPFADGSMDFGYSLGVLHHIPDTQAAMASCVRKLKPGAPFLVYLYYAMENRPLWYRGVWRASEAVRAVVSRMPFSLRYGASQALAATVYFPLARAATVAERVGANVEGWPLSGYRDLSFYAMRTDALDRFGTRLEQRFTRQQIAEMMDRAGLERVRFHEGFPYWCAVGHRR